MVSAPRGPAILIVGAGPTGLTLAHELLRRGITPRIIEKAPYASPNTKALGVLPRTLEALAPAGITREMLELGVRVPTFSVWSAGQRLAQLDFSREVDSPYPFILMIPQHATEAILADRLAQQGCPVERGVELIHFTQRAEHVEAVLRHADGETEEVARCALLIGCDGAHSRVRQVLGARFRGVALKTSFASGDIRLHGQLPHDQAMVFLGRGHLIAFFPLPDGYHRFLITHPARESPAGEVTLAEVQRTIEICGPADWWATDPRWLARYHVHQRTVDSYVHRRALLVGDAAHIHSPLAAQGMNTGIQDAVNLAWKLALVAGKRAPARLLETYQSERARVGQRLVWSDRLLTGLVALRHPLATSARDRIAPPLLRQPHIHRALARTVAGLDISYHRGSLAMDVDDHSDAISGRLVAGDRAPDGLLISGRHGKPNHLHHLLSGTCHTLLVFMAPGAEMRWRRTQAALGAFLGLVDIVIIHRQAATGDGTAWHDSEGALAKRYGIADEGLVLIRPDGYISFRCQSIAAEPLRRYLSAHFIAQQLA